MDDAKNNSWILDEIFVMETEKIKINEKVKKQFDSKIYESWIEFLDNIEDDKLQIEKS